MRTHLLQPWCCSVKIIYTWKESFKQSPLSGSVHTIKNLGQAVWVFSYKPYRYKLFFWRGIHNGSQDLAQVPTSSRGDIPQHAQQEQPLPRILVPGKHAGLAECSSSLSWGLFANRKIHNILTIVFVPSSVWAVLWCHYKIKAHPVLHLSDAVEAKKFTPENQQLQQKTCYS